MSHFNRSFIRLRTQNGFKTAYNFYHSNGGRRVFQFTYAHYLKIERGGSLPQPAALSIMLKLLRMTLPSPERKALIGDYLRDLCGDDAAYDDLFATLLSAPEAPARGKTLPLVLGRLAVNITPAQFQAVVSSPEATGCYMLFANIPDALTLEQVAERLGSPKAKCLAAIKLFQRQRLLVARGAGRYSCAISPERGWRMPNSHGFEPLYDAMEDHIDRLAGRHSRSHWGRSTPIRLQAAALNQWTRDVDEAFNVAASLSEKMIPSGPETPLYYIEAHARRVAAFPPPDAEAPAGPAARIARSRRPAKPR